MSPPADERAAAARLLHQVLANGRTSDQAMAGLDVTPLTRELVLGSLRHYFSLGRLVDSALHRSLKPKDVVLRSLMIVGAYQLRFTRVPDHAAIFETVNACAGVGRPWARGLVNAVLRQCAAAPSAQPSSEHPEWLEHALRLQYPDAEAIMHANNGRAPMTVRINLARTTADAYLTTLEAAGIRSRRPGAPETEDGLDLGPATRVLAEPCPANTLPGYAEGLVAVQDAGAQFAAGLLSPTSGERVLDACAAPGGKLFHLMERCPGARYAAVEQSGERLSRMLTEAERLGHSGFTALEADATTLHWWDGAPFDRVLVDAPCTGTGTLRRHPDIKVLRRPADVEAMAGLQGRLLANLWRVLTPGGTLLYCTCSILAAENDEVISRFLAHRPEAIARPCRLATGRATRHGWQLLPTQADTDGFYYARMIKASQ